MLTDCVPSKTLIATAEVMTEVEEAGQLGLRVEDGDDDPANSVRVELAVVNQRVKALAAAQSEGISRRLADDKVRVINGRGRLDGPEAVVVGDERLDADVVLIATGARPRILKGSEPDGERILTWEQVYELEELPERLIVVGSGVTGAEFASAYDALGSDVVLVSSRDRVLPGEDQDAAGVLEDVFKRRGMTVLGKSRAESVKRQGDGVVVTLTDGTKVEGSHALLAVGSLPNTEDMGLVESGVSLGDGGFITVDKVSRTSARGVYAAGDCTGVLMLASVAAMQGRIAMSHALGDAVAPLNLSTVSSNVFTAPEIATVGLTQATLDAGDSTAMVVKVPLRDNARAKMQGNRDGFVKLFCLPNTGIIVGGVVVAPRASELIHPIALAVGAKLTVDQMAQSFTVYPSVSGSIAEAARRLHLRS
ncbi:NAD(P)H-quinone dehydrogenase [Kribbella sancticallisti]|uniref:NAD(P)H-quinone dehydrogenase n=1 Tax=Kribbella sancticallisti TaxID=460087 RepID=A0ABN2CFT7_9ACTN